MRRHAVSVVMALLLAAIAVNFLLQATVGERRRAAAARAEMAAQHEKQMSHLAAFMKQRAPYREERERLGLTPPEYRKLLAERGAPPPSDQAHTDSQHRREKAAGSVGSRPRPR